ncbi:MAG: hypothetical protein J1D99_02180 [Campylobacter sp.]|nr:hypothetical protein [Campylobacter sp.]
MASSVEFKDFVIEQLECNSSNMNFSFKKMFGEYFIYLNLNPAFLICNDIVYVKQFEELKILLKDNELSCPFKGAKEWFVLDIENSEILSKIIEILGTILPKYYKNSSKMRKNAKNCH